jgi:hypothetical protein
MVNPSKRLQGTQAGLEVDDAGLTGTRIVLFEEVCGGGWRRYGMAAHGSKPGGDAGWHDH